MVAIVLQLQQDALDRDIPLSDLVRKALVVAKKLNLKDFERWISDELNGYGSGEVPEYRVIPGEIRWWNPYRGWLPLLIEDNSLAEGLSKRGCGQSIGELEHLIGGDGKGGLQMPLPLDVQRVLSKGMGYETQIGLSISKTSLIRIAETVRTIVLNWALKLEADGILGEDFSFTSKERAVAQKTPQIVTNFFGTVNNPQLQQGNEVAHQVHNATDINLVRLLLEGISKELPKLSLTAEEKAEVDADIQTIEAQIESPKPKDGIVRASLQSIKAIFESAAGSAAGQIIVDIAKYLG